MININPLFEALQYFHRRAEGRLVRIELDRLCTRFPSKTNEFLRLLSPVADLQDRLDYLVRVGKRELSQLLTPVCSSPTPFACSNSIMYMMVFPAIRDGIDPENFTEYIYSKTDEDIMVDILSVLESPGTATVTEEITSDVFYERLENTGLDEQARLGVMKLLFKYKSYSERVSLLVDGFLNAMRRERENVASICSAFSKRYPEGSGVLKKVNDCYGMGLPDDIEMTPYCSIFMYDHIAAFVKQYQDDTGKDSGMVLMGSVMTLFQAFATLSLPPRSSQCCSKPFPSRAVWTLSICFAKAPPTDRSFPKRPRCTPPPFPIIWRALLRQTLWNAICAPQKPITRSTKNM